MLQYKLEIPGADSVTIRLEKSEGGLAYLFRVDNIWISEEFLTLFDVSSEDRIRKIFKYLSDNHGFEFDAKKKTLKLHCDLFDSLIEFQLERRDEQSTIYIRMYISPFGDFENKDSFQPRVEKFSNVSNTWKLDRVLTKELHRGMIAHILERFDSNRASKDSYFNSIASFRDDMKKAIAFVKSGVGKIEDFIPVCKVSFSCQHYDPTDMRKVTSRCPISDRFQKFLPLKNQEAFGYYVVYLVTSPVVPPWTLLGPGCTKNEGWVFCE
jgi:hypothetical protein